MSLFWTFRYHKELTTKTTTEYWGQRFHLAAWTRWNVHVYTCLFFVFCFFVKRKTIVSFLGLKWISIVNVHCNLFHFARSIKSYPVSFSRKHEQFWKWTYLGQASPSTQWQLVEQRSTSAWCTARKTEKTIIAFEVNLDLLAHFLISFSGFILMRWRTVLLRAGFRLTPRNWGHIRMRWLKKNLF